jgi:hypothetical protein
MDEELVRSYTRWREAEQNGVDSEADAAFGRVFRSAVREPAVSAAFAPRTMEAVAAAAARDARRARRTRRLVFPLATIGIAALVYLSAGLIATALSATLVRVLDLLVAAVVGAATTMPARADAWTVVTSLGRAAAALIANPAVTITVIAIQGFALAALIALQRLLGSDRESFR